MGGLAGLFSIVRLGWLIMFSRFGLQGFVFKVFCVRFSLYGLVCKVGSGRLNFEDLVVNVVFLRLVLSLVCKDWFAK